MGYDNESSLNATIRLGMYADHRQKLKSLTISAADMDGNEWRYLHRSSMHLTQLELMGSNDMTPEAIEHSKKMLATGWQLMTSLEKLKIIQLDGDMLGSSPIHLPKLSELTLFATTATRKILEVFSLANPQVRKIVIKDVRISVSDLQLLPRYFPNVQEVVLRISWIINDTNELDIECVNLKCLKSLTMTDLFGDPCIGKILRSLVEGEVSLQSLELNMGYVETDADVFECIRQMGTIEKLTFGGQVAYYISDRLKHLLNNHTNLSEVSMYTCKIKDVNLVKANIRQLVHLTIKSITVRIDGTVEIKKADCEDIADILKT